jgi:hypothetical protein
MDWPRRSELRELPAELGQPASVLLLADPVWPFEAVADALSGLGYAGWIARSPEEAWMRLSTAGRRADVVVACASTGREEGLQWIFEAGPTHPELRALVILDLERCAAPVVIAWRLARLPNLISIIEFAASPQWIVSRIEALLFRPAPSPRTSPLGRAA